MPSLISRRKLAEYAAKEILTGNDGVTKQLAAYLIETRRTRELDLIVRDIEDVLADRGLIVAEVTTAHRLDSATKKSVTKYVERHKRGSVHLRERVDPAVLGGLRITLPDSERDGTLRHKLETIMANKW